METTGDSVADLFDELTIGELAERAADAQRAAGTEVSDADLDAAQVRARTIIAETRRAAADVKESGTMLAHVPAPPLAGMDDMRDLSLSIGLPVPRILFTQAVGASTATKGKKKAWMRGIGAMSDVSETGCIQADFFDTSTQAQNTAYLVFDECGDAHDLGAQLEKIFSRVAADKHDDIKKHLSMLVYLGRSAYGQMMMKMAPLLADLGKKLPNDFDSRLLVVDPDNTTLSLNIAGTRRVGIFVRFASEILPAVAPIGGGPSAGSKAADSE
jgi:hypothetical protein